jgi:serine/threonine protein kinase
MAEVQRLVALRHPNITYVFDAFECRNTFYIITERCHLSGHDLFRIPNFNGSVWVQPVARTLLQAVYYIHVNRYVHQDIHLGNLFAQFPRNELLNERQPGLQFKLADLGIAKLADEVDAQNTRAQWMLPPEVLSPSEFGPTDHRGDIYHVGLLLLQFAYSTEMTFTTDEILAGKPRELALSLPSPLSITLEKALRRHVQYRTASAMEMWRDLNSAVGSPPASGSSASSSVT